LNKTKVWRLSLALIFAFGWLLSTPTEAHPDDPITVAEQEIVKLNNKLEDLAYKEKLSELIDISENKLSYAKNARQIKNSALESHEDSIEAEELAIDAKNLAQSNVDGQTAVVSTALTNKNNAQDALDIANLNVATTQENMQASDGQGLQYTVYTLVRQNGVAVPGEETGCYGTLNVASMQPGPSTCGRTENFIVKFTGQIVVPSHWTTTRFAGFTDDGFKMYVNGQLATSQWIEQGSNWSPFTPYYDVTEDKTLDVEIWWYNGGGPGYYHLGWAIPGGWSGAGCDYTGGWGVDFSCDLDSFSSGPGATQEQINAYNQAVQAKAQAQAVYNDKSSIYSQEVQVLAQLNQNLTTATQNLTTAQENLTNALNAKNNAIETYNQSIVDLNASIDDAWKYYYEQSEREVLAALALAAANQPTPEPSPEPSPEPTEEQTPEPSPEPSPDPSESPSEPDTDPIEPTPTPTPDPTPEPSPEPSEGVTDPSEEIVEEEPEVVTPEEPSLPEPETLPEEPGKPEDLSGMIANLTNKDNILSLTVEQKSVLANTLGIKTEEIKLLAQIAQENTSVAEALSTFENRASENTESVMPYTLADAVTEVQTEALLSDPVAFLTDIDFEKLSSPSEWGKDMTDDQREKAQEVIVPVIIASNIVAAAMTRRK